MTAGSLFSGIGGFDLALNWAGIEIAWQVEIDSFCNKVLAKHWPNVKRYGDIKNVKGEELESVDIVVGGPPCQPASCAGKRRGEQDDRWLWPEALRIVSELKPSFCLFENPTGILSLEGGLLFENLLLEMESQGYTVQAFIIPACAVGAPHRRDRVWIVANLHCGGLDQGRSSLSGQKGGGTFACDTDCHVADPDRFNGDNAGYGSGKISQFQEAEICGGDVTDAHSDRTGERYNGDAFGKDDQEVSGRGDSEDTENTGSNIDDDAFDASDPCITRLSGQFCGQLGGISSQIR